MYLSPVEEKALEDQFQAQSLEEGVVDEKEDLSDRTVDSPSVALTIDLIPENEEQRCPICCEMIESSKGIPLCKARHRVHFECLIEIEHHELRNCPLCRRRMLHVAPSPPPPSPSRREELRRGSSVSADAYDLYRGISDDGDEGEDPLCYDPVMKVLVCALVGGGFAFFSFLAFELEWVSGSLSTGAACGIGGGIGFVLSCVAFSCCLEENR